MPSIWKDDFKKLHGGNKIWVSVIDAETELFICTGYQAWEAAGRPKLMFRRIMLACQLRLNEVWTYEYELNWMKVWIHKLSTECIFYHSKSHAV